MKMEKQDPIKCKYHQPRDSSPDFPCLHGVYHGDGFVRMPCVLQMKAPIVIRCTDYIEVPEHIKKWEKRLV